MSIVCFAIFSFLSTIGAGEDGFDRDYVFVSIGVGRSRGPCLEEHERLFVVNLIVLVLIVNVSSW